MPAAFKKTPVEFMKIILVGLTDKARETAAHEIPFLPA
jgi:hypothetical protein